MAVRIRTLISRPPSPGVGHGGHHDVPRPAPAAGVRERFDLELNITEALQAQKDDAKGVSLKLVAVNSAGNEIPADKLILEEAIIELE